MKAQCERCKEIVPLEFSLAEAGIDVSCPACGAAYFVAAPAPPGAARPAPASSGPTCPKCGDPRSADATACRRCGLVFAKWRGFVAAADASELPIGDAVRMKTLWELTLEAWDDPARHDAFIATCCESGGFAYAAGRYRAVLGERPDDAAAGAGLARVRKLAEQALAPSPRDLLAPRSPPTGSKPEGTLHGRALFLIGFLVLLVVVAAALLYGMRHIRGHTARPTAAPTKPP